MSISCLVMIIHIVSKTWHCHLASTQPPDLVTDLPSAPCSPCSTPNMSTHETNNPKPSSQTSDSVRQFDTETVLRGYYLVVFGLLRGSAQRPRLPLELVIHICRLARFSQPNPSRDFSVHRVIPGPSMPHYSGKKTNREILLKTPPLATHYGGSLGIDRLEVVVKGIRVRRHRVSTQAEPPNFDVS